MDYQNKDYKMNWVIKCIIAIVLLNKLQTPLINR